MRRALALTGAALATVAMGAGALLADGDEGRPPSDRAAAFVPASARVYLNVSVRSGGFERFREALRRLPTVETERDDLLALVSARLPEGGGIDLARDVDPWLEGEAAIALLGSGRHDRDFVAVLETRDRAAAERSLGGLAGSTLLQVVGGVEIAGSPRLAYAIDRGFALVGTPEGVRRAVGARSGATRSLAGSRDYRELRAGLPGDRFATGYLSNAGLRERLPGAAAAVAQIGGARELRAAAVGLTLGEERGELVARAMAVRPNRCEPPPAGSGAPRERRATGELLASAPAGAAAFAELSAADCVLRDLAAAGGTAGRALAALAREARRTSALRLDRDLLPLLRHGAALIVTESDGIPVLTLVAGRVSEQPALDVLARLQPALVRLLAPVRRGQAPAFGAQRLANGEDALTAELGPGLRLSYAAFGGRLAISTSPQGIESATAGGLAASQEVRQALGAGSSGSSALLFLDLDQLLALAEQVGLAEDPAYLAVRDDLQKLGAASAVVRREGKHTIAELSFQNP